MTTDPIPDDIKGMILRDPVQLLAELAARVKALEKTVDKIIRDKTETS